MIEINVKKTKSKINIFVLLCGLGYILECGLGYVMVFWIEMCAGMWDAGTFWYVG